MVLWGMLLLVGDDPTLPSQHSRGYRLRYHVCYLITPPSRGPLGWWSFVVAFLSKGSARAVSSISVKLGLSEKSAASETTGGRQR